MQGKGELEKKSKFILLGKHGKQDNLDGRGR